MPFISIAASRIDYDSPVNEQLIEDINTDLLFLNDSKIDLGGTRPWTGDQDADGHAINNLSALEVDSLTVNQSFSGIGRVMSSPTLNLITTSSGTNGRINCTAAEDFTLGGIVADDWFALIPDLSDNFLFVVDAVIDADSIDVAKSTSLGPISDTVPSSAAVSLIDSSKGNFKKIKTGTLSATSVTANVYVYDEINFELDWVKEGYARRCIKIVITNWSTGSVYDTLDISFGDKTQYEVDVNNQTFGLFCTGDTTLILRIGTKHVNPNPPVMVSCDYDIYVEMPIGS